MAHKEQPELKDRLVPKGFKDSKVRLELRDFKEQLAAKAQLERKDLRARREPPVILVRKVP